MVEVPNRHKLETALQVLQWYHTARAIQSDVSSTAVLPTGHNTTIFACDIDVRRSSVTFEATRRDYAADLLPVR